MNFSTPPEDHSTSLLPYNELTSNHINITWSRFKIVRLTSIAVTGERSIETGFLLRRYSIGDLLAFGIDLVISLETVTKKSLKTLGISDGFDVKLPFLSLILLILEREELFEIIDFIPCHNFFILYLFSAK